MGNDMLLNPTDRFLLNKGKKEANLNTAKNMIDEGFPIEEIIKLTGLTKEDILNLE